jgi:cation:H+ antiporter
VTPATWQTGLLIWLKFALAAAAIAYAGYRLSACGDIIAEKKGWGRVWLGTALMAAVTSLPELVSTLSAVTVTQAPDLAVGQVLGSCAFNLLLISLLDLLYLKAGRATVFDFTSRGHVIAGGFGVFMLGLIPLSMGLRPLWGVPALGRVSLATLLLALFYLLAVRSVFQYETSAADERSYTQLYGEMSLGAAVRGFLLNTLVVAAAGSYLPVVGLEISAFHGWGASLVGTLLLALATSLPEVVVTVGAVWLGAIDLAVGNIFGSNLFNLFILFCGDLAYAQGPLLARVAPVHLVTATIAMMMTGLALVGMILRPRRLALPLLSWVTLWIVLLFGLNAAVLIGVEAF